MICQQLTSLLGFDCSPLTESGNVVLVSTPFRFDDGDAVPVFAEIVSDQIRFFDDGHTLMHFIGRGIRIDNKKHASFLSTAAQKNGASFTEAGEIEIWASVNEAPAAFSKYVASLLALTSWERDQRGIGTDAVLFVEEVAMALHAWKPGKLIEIDPQFEGISGRGYRLDFMIDGEAIVATGAHPNAVSSVLHKLIDIRGRLDNSEMPLMVVIDDRVDPDAARREAMIIQRVATVMPVTSLEAKRGNSLRVH